MAKVDPILYAFVLAAAKKSLEGVDRPLTALELEDVASKRFLVADRTLLLEVIF